VSSRDVTTWITAWYSTPRNGDLAGPIRLLHNDQRRRADATVARAVASVKTFYRWAANAGLVTRQVANQVSACAQPKVTKNHDVGRLEAHTVSLLLDVDMGARERFLVELLYGCGLRTGEALGLWFEDLHLESDNRSLGCEMRGPHVHIEPRDGRRRARAKGGPRVVPVTGRTVAFYRDWMAQRFEVLGDDDPAAAVFVALAGPTRGSPWSYQAMQKWWDREIRSRPQLADATRHALRHTFSSELLDAGVSRHSIQALLGHAVLESTSRYSHAALDTMRQAVEARSEWVDRRVRTTTSRGPEEPS
jgi:site-specific recombinase XerD